MVKGDYREKWKLRSKCGNASLRSVLYTGMPEYVNEAIDEWHRRIVTNKFLVNIPHDGKVIDIGSGYGRMSAHSLMQRPDLQILGIDFSVDFCKVYHRRFGNAICGDIRALPVKKNMADGVMLITSLMYLVPDHKKALKEIVSVLRPGGYLLLVEPGSEAINLIRRLVPAAGKRSTGGEGFTRKEFEELFDDLPCDIVKSGGNMLFTLMLPFILFLKRRPGISVRLAKGIARLENSVRLYSKYALHRWVLVRVDV